MISFDGVTKRYPARRGGGESTAVDSLTLAVEPGEFTVFVGPSGGGKTTAMRMINRMIDPSAGTLTVDGRDVSSVDPVKLRRGIGYVIQNAGLMPHQRVVDNVATVPVLNGQTRRQARKDALAVLERVGLDPALAQRYPAQLSGGQQQRVGVARALAGDPPILLMDEPFSAVDPVVRDDLQREVRRLQAELNKTIVFVTHDIDEAITLGDRIAVFGPGGKLAQYDTPQTLLTRPANEFVAGFVGRDRGYRGLQFRAGDEVPIHPLDTIGAADVANVPWPDRTWRLLLDEQGRALGWMDGAGAEKLRGGASVAESVAVGGSLFGPGETLRQALDAALSSPSNIGVAVDGDGRPRGGIDGAEVLALIQRPIDG